MNAPFQTLAPELLCKIFRLAAPQTDAKVALSAVCSHWRACALGDASWWADMRQTSMSYRPTSMPQRLFELALERSRRAPLSVFLSPQENKFLPILQPHVQRIWRLLLFFDVASPPAFLQSGLELPALEFLSVRNWHSGVSVRSLRFRAPRLETLNLHGIVVHQWNSLDIPALRHFKYDSYTTTDLLDDGVPVHRILHRLLSMCAQIRTIGIGGRCHLGDDTLMNESSAYGQVMEELRLTLCCAACGVRILDALPRTVERSRVLRIATNRLDPNLWPLHEDSDVQQRCLVMALASGHTYIHLHLAEQFGHGQALSATFESDSRTVHVTLPVRSFLLNWPAEWRSLRLSDTLQSITLPLGLWPEFALLTQGQPLTAARVRVCVLARSWNDLTQRLDVAHCGLLDCLELCVPGSRKDGASSFRMQPILHLTSVVACVSERVKLVLERSDDPSADASLEERLLSALHAKRVARSGSQPEWTIEWKE